VPRASPPLLFRNAGRTNRPRSGPPSPPDSRPLRMTILRGWPRNSNAGRMRDRPFTRTNPSPSFSTVSRPMVGPTLASLLRQYIAAIVARQIVVGGSTTARIARPADL